MSEFQALLEKATLWPTLPITVVLAICTLYWLLVIVGLFDLDFLDIDLDVDLDGEAPMSVGVIGLKFLNLGDVPLMLWTSVLSLSAWLISMWFDHSPRPETWPAIAGALARDLGIGVLLTKVLTNPLRGKFDPHEPNRVEDLLGKHCVIVSREVTEAHGQARVQAEAAPLLLNVRSTGGTLHKGDRALLVDHSAEDKVFYVQSVDQNEV